MTSGSSYVEVFGGNVVKPAQPSYLALSIAVDTTLVWPIETTQGQPVVAAEIDITATVVSLSLAMPPGNTGSSGVATLIENVGSHSFLVTDQGGNPITVITPTQAWIISLTDNSTANGTWRASQLAATTSTATAAALAGPGLQAAGSLLQVNWSTPAALSTNTTITSAYRAATVEWIGPAGTLQLDTIANLGVGWFCAITNIGSAVVTLSTSGGQTINGLATLSIPVGNSGLVVCTPTGFLTFGAVLSPLGVANGGTGATTAAGALTNLGGTTIGQTIFTAPNAAAIVALLGLSASTFTESSVSSDQMLNAGSTGTAFVCTTALAITLPLTTVLTTQFIIIVSAQGGAATMTPQSTDAIGGGSAGSTYTLPQGASALFVTNANGNWYPVFDDLPRAGGTLLGALNIASGGASITGGLIVTNTGLTVTAGGITVGAGGIGVSGNSHVTGTFATSAQLIVNAGGIAVTGASVIAGTLGGITGLTVASGGANVTGNSTFNNNVGISGFLNVSGTNGVAVVSGWDYDNAGGAAAVGGTYNFNIIAANANVLAVAYFAVSDERLKSEIAEISEADGEAWVMHARPITYRKSGNPEAGLLAQDQIRAGYGQYVASLPSPGLPELNDRGVVSHADVELSLSYSNYIAYLTAALQSALRRIDALEAAAG